MTSVSVSPVLPPVSGSLVRARLCRAREELHQLEVGCPRELAADLSDVLGAIEGILAARFGWRGSERPLTGTDLAWFAATDPGALTADERARLAAVGAL